jgi:hypothetical protein
LLTVLILLFLPLLTSAEDRTAATVAGRAANPQRSFEEGEVALQAGNLEEAQRDFLPVLGRGKKGRGSLAAAAKMLNQQRPSPQNELEGRRCRVRNWRGPQ